MNVIEISGVLFYKNHYCHCGCNERISYPITSQGRLNHKNRGIPKYKHGHNRTSHYEEPEENIQDTLVELIQEVLQKCDYLEQIIMENRMSKKKERTKLRIVDVLPESGYISLRGLARVAHVSTEEVFASLPEGTKFTKFGEEIGSLMVGIKEVFNPKNQVVKPKVEPEVPEKPVEEKKK